MSIILLDKTVTSFCSWGSPNICSYLTLFLTIFEVDSFSTILDMVLVILGSSLTEGAWKVIIITTPNIDFAIHRTTPQGMKEINIFICKNRSQDIRLTSIFFIFDVPYFRDGGQMFKGSFLYFLLNHVFEELSTHWFNFSSYSMFRSTFLRSISTILTKSPGQGSTTYKSDGDWL